MSKIQLELCDVVTIVGEDLRFEDMLFDISHMSHLPRIGDKIWIEDVWPEAKENELIEALYSELLIGFYEVNQVRFMPLANKYNVRCKRIENPTRETLRRVLKNILTWPS